MTIRAVIPEGVDVRLNATWARQDSGSASK
jgi:hypothetical protein